jgi:hypothetical protein
VAETESDVPSWSMKPEAPSLTECQTALQSASKSMMAPYSDADIVRTSTTAPV